MPAPIDRFVQILAEFGWVFGGPVPGEAEAECFRFHGTRPGLPDFDTLGRLMPFIAFNALMASQNYVPCELDSTRDSNTDEVATFEPEDSDSGRMSRTISVRRVDGRDFVTMNSVVRFFDFSS